MTRLSRRPPVLLRRLGRLYVGLALYGLSAALQVRAGLGLAPWDVLHQGLAELTGHAIGTMSIAVGCLVLLLWIPLHTRPGVGTVSNVFMVGLVLDLGLWALPAPHQMLGRIALLCGGVLLCGAATGLYITAELGSGPRDGLMTGLARHFGVSIRLTRTIIEVVVLALGWSLGGSVGVGTVVFAACIGPLSQLFLRLFARHDRDVVTSRG